MAKRRGTERKRSREAEDAGQVHYGVLAGQRRRGIRTVSELKKQANRLRHQAVEIDQLATEAAAKNITKFEMDGETQFDRADALISKYLIQVNRWIGKAQYG